MADSLTHFCISPSLAIIKKENLIPCHRVIKSGGEVGEYKDGNKKKIKLLKKEGVIVVKRKIVLPRRSLAL